MTNGDPVVNLDVSGPTARSIAASILSIVDETDCDIDGATVEIVVGDTSITLDGSGPRAEGLIPQMVSSIDWGKEGIDSLSVVLSEPQGEGFVPPDNPEHGDRMTPWESPDVENYNSVSNRSQRGNILALLRDYGPMTSNQLSDELESPDNTVASAMSQLFNKCGLVDRSRVYTTGSGGLMFTYRINDHGRLVLKDD